MQITCNWKKDASTGTRGGKLSEIWSNENDEMFVYIENTESLIARSQLVQHGARENKKLQLPLRKSLFAHVPQCIVFQIAHKPEKSPLPAELSKHLTWKSSGISVPRVLHKSLKISGFSLTKNSHDSWLGTWLISPNTINLENLQLFQKINQYPGIHELSNKILLWKNYRHMKRKFGDNFNYMPMTYIIPEECLKFKKRIRQVGGIWIVKPPNFCAGQGIHVISKYCEIPRHLPHIVQNYLTRPHLINDLKFDLRLYILVTSLNPLRIYLYSEGLVRFATEKYLINVKNLDDKFMHLTNTSINKYSPHFRGNDSVNSCKGSMWSLHSLWTHLARYANANVHKIWNRIKDIVIKTIITSENSLVNSFAEKMPSTYNAYQLFGFDVILDENLKPWLLEVNGCPSMVPNTPLCDIVKGRLVEDFLNLLGFHLPTTISAEEREILSAQHGEPIFSYDHQLYDSTLSEEEIAKHERFLRIKNRDDYLMEILQDLTADDVRILIRHEDEVARRGNFEKIFPTPATFEYFKYFQNQKYYNILLDSWENNCGWGRKSGVERLRKLCRNRHHLRK